MLLTAGPATGINDLAGVIALAEHPQLRSVDIARWFGLWGPAGLPASVAARLRTALADSFAPALSAR
jgi:hypothetical protein